VRTSARFDVAAADVPAAGIHLGRILDRGRPIPHEYPLTTKGLNKHTLVVGITGSGKTNTVFQLLVRLWQQGIPFLVIEPTKTEYRGLLQDPAVGAELRIFTLGNERVSPFRMNPFDLPGGVSLSSHIDLLKSAFNAAFSMWTVLPQILEQSLHEVYREYGWDIVRTANERLRDGPGQASEALPTLTDLQQTVSRVVDRLGYEPNTTSELKAALLTRIQSLRIGGKGRMLDTRETYPMAALLEKPTVLELQEIGDDDEKAFVIGILLARLYEHLRGCEIRPGSPLRHVVVVEEAHRLLANVPREVRVEVANNRGKAVETFVNMLAEVRAYGEGFIVAEQIPDKLAPDLIKNTNVKVVHRTIAGDDRRLLAQAMNMEEQQAEMLATLLPGEAVVFAEGDDRPIMVQVDRYERGGADFSAMEWETQVVASGQRAAGTGPPADTVASALCRLSNSAEWDRARTGAASPALQRLVGGYILDIVERENALIDDLPEVLAESRRYQPGLGASDDFLRSLLLQSIDLQLRDLARAYGWSFGAAAALRDDLNAILLQAFDVLAKEGNGSAPAVDRVRLARFRERYRDLCVREFDPFVVCAQVCDQKPRVCMYRRQVERLLDDGGLTRQFGAGIHASTDPDVVIRELLAISLNATERLVGFQLPLEARNRAALCYSVQQLALQHDLPARSRDVIVSRLVAARRESIAQE
jgi:hypothetical protein